MKYLLIILISSVGLADINSLPECRPIVKHKRKHVAKKQAPKVEPIVITKTVEPKKNRVRLLGGVGPVGVDKQLNPTVATLRSNIGPVIGVGYDRLITNEFSVGAQVLSNETLTLGLGFDF